MIKKSVNQNYIILLLIILLASLLRIAAIATRPIWYDEASAILFAEKGIDRGSRREYEEGGSRDAYGRALNKVKEILKNYTPRAFDRREKEELDRIIRAHAKQFGVDQLPIMDIH